MIGSTIIAEKNSSRLTQIKRVDDLVDFVFLNLETLNTLDFQTIVIAGGKKWAEGDPIKFDSVVGMAIFKISPDGLAYVLGHISHLDEAKQADLRKFDEFVRVNGNLGLYEFATF